MGIFDFFKRKPSIPREALTVSVHRQSFFECAKSANQLGAGFSFNPLCGVFGLTPALRTTQDLIYVTDRELEGLGLSHDEALAIGSEQAARSLNEARGRDGFVFWQGQGVEVVVMMGPMVAPHLPIKGRPVVMVPAERVALMAGTDDLAALELMIDTAEKAYRDSDDFVSLRAVSWPPGSILPAEWLPPEGHPLRTRFLTLAAKTRRHEAQGLHLVHAAESSPLAPLTASDAHGGTLCAAWMRDADVVIPRVDRVVLVDTDDAALPRLDVDLDTLLEFCPAAFEPIAIDGKDEEVEDAQLMRLRGTLFPTPIERRFLLQRMAFDAQSPGTEDREVPAEELLAEWDKREVVRAEAAFGQVGHVQLEMPDRRFALVPVAVFGRRFEQRSLQEQARLQESFVVNSMLAMLELKEGESLEADDFPEFADDLREKALASRPLLMSSNNLRAMVEELGKDEKIKPIVELVLSTWEPSQLFPAVRPPGYEEGKHANDLGMAQGAFAVDPSNVIHSQSVSRPAAEGLRLDLVSDRGNRMMVLSNMLLTPELTEAAWCTALLNVEAASLVGMKLVENGLYVSPWEDDYDFARVLLLPRLVTACKVKGTPLVFAPTVGQVWVTGSEDEQGLARVLGAVEEHLGSGDAITPYQYRQMLFGWPWTVRDGALVKAPVPAAFAKRIAALDAKLSRRREESRKHVGDFARAVSSPTTEQPEGSA